MRKFSAIHLSILRRCLSTESAETKINATVKTTENINQQIKDFPLIYPEFLPSPVWERRISLFEKLQKADMLERRMHIDIPEFYVGSILAVTTSDPNQQSRQNRFVGICIRREKPGLLHQFTLRNVIDGLGVEIMYELYNPTILKIETLKLEKRLDNDLSYLIDALPEYSTFDFNLEPIAHPVGKPIPINETKVKLRQPPWSQRWELYDFKGIDNPWNIATPYYKRKLRETKIQDYFKYDLIRNYRDHCQELEYETKTQNEMKEFEKLRHKTGATKRKILKSAADGI
uniref:Large ribosomal subunit protein bL19m n=1 Tax=Panagrolaimus sp. JU765 TaxID=591449 RepID=A0AC34Q6M6_9BILA